MRANFLLAAEGVSKYQPGVGCARGNRQIFKCELTGREREILLIQGDARHFAHLPADLALANIHLNVLLDLLAIPEFLNKKWYIFSGILGTQMAQFTARLQASPLKLLDTWSENLWFAVLARKD